MKWMCGYPPCEIHADYVVVYTTGDNREHFVYRCARHFTAAVEAAVSAAGRAEVRDADHQ